MRLAARHSKTGERFRLMDDETLRRVMQRRHKHAADQPADQRAAQAELRRRREAKCHATTARTVARVEGVGWTALCTRCGWQSESKTSLLLAQVAARAHNREAEARAS